MHSTSAIHHACESGVSSLDFLWLEITEKCNLICTHCYAESGPGRSLTGGLRTEDWRQIISDAAAEGCRSVQFVGGEPTLHPALAELLAHARSEKFHLIEVFTNATALTPARIEVFKRYGVRVACSFYSHRESVHTEITGVRKSFARTVAGIQAVVAARLPLRVGIIEGPENRDDIESAMEYLRLLGVTDCRVDRLRRIGRGARPGGSTPPQGSELCGQCWKGKLCVTASGTVYPCVMSRETVVGDIRRHNLSEIVTSLELRDFRSRIRKHFAAHASAACGPWECGPNTSCSPNAHCSPAESCQPRTPCNPADWCNPNAQCMPGN